MRQAFNIVFLMLFVCILASCGSDKETDIDEKVDEGVSNEAGDEADKKVEAEEEPELSVEEAKDITIETLQNIEGKMGDLSESEETEEWHGVDWDDRDSDPEIYDKGLAKTKEALQTYIDDDILEELSLYYLLYDYNILEGRSNSSQKVGVRFQLLAQSEDSFTASYLILVNEAGYSAPGTFEMTFFKNDGIWKLREQSFMTADEQPMNLTVKDIKEDAVLYQEDGDETEPDVREIDVTDVDGAPHIVYEMNDFISARNVNTSEFNHELAEQYRDASDEQSADEMDESNEGEDAGVADAESHSNYDDYETVTMEEINDLVELSVEYPEFGIDGLDRKLKPMAEEIYNDFLKEQGSLEALAEEVGFQLSRVLSFSDVILTDEYASIMFSNYQYDGGPHGYYNAAPFNYSFKKGKMIDIKDVLNGSKEKLESVSQIVRSYLEDRSDVFQENVPEMTEPKWDNFSTFFLTEDSMVIIYQLYEVAPYASGIVEIEIPFEDLE